MESELSTVIKLLERSAKGSEEALDTLGLKNGFDYTFPRPFNPEKSSKTTLEEHIIQTSFFAAAANKLGLEGCEKVACMAMRHMMYSYSCLFDKAFILDELLNGQDLSEDMLTFVRDLCRTMDMLRIVEDREAQKVAKNAPAAREQSQIKKLREKKRVTKRRRARKHLQLDSRKSQRRETKRATRVTKRVMTA